MEVTSQPAWAPVLLDPTQRRQAKPRTSGKTMVIDKGLGLNAFEDLLQTAAEHIDMLKIGFGTSPLYPTSLLTRKIEMAKKNDIIIYPGGTFLEVAIAQKEIDSYLETVLSLGFTGLEVSDGTIEVDRSLRSELITRGVQEGLAVITEYGKKGWGSTIELQELIETVMIDLQTGAELVTIEGRESGAGVGIYDEHGKCKDEELEAVLAAIPSRDVLLWEAPQKQQQVHLLQLLGPEVNLGNIPAHDVVALEALRRGLRSDTFHFGTKRSKADGESGMPSV
ncbi:phosphosulfolactate synthase [Paenibacillus chartarius]|uniref:Phosphosulfolactate synthase n=1 Tax=Paenibacillus chartarius TaxID=747481 RepID=A0ABV6DNH2_9BACL